MNEKALKTLEYDKIINMLVSYASSELGRKKCETLLPIIDYDTIISEQKETSDAVNRIRLKGSTNFGNAKDIYASLKRLEMGSPLSIIELLNVGKLLSNVSKVKGYGYHEEDENFDSLEHYFRELDPILVIEKEISKCIISEDMIADSASSELSRIRRQQKNITSKMHSELNTILNAHREYLMDNVITMRNGSYCLPVKSEFKNKVQGIVHDQSATGSTFFIEPLAVIRMNNELRELEIKEKKEIEIILERLSTMVSPYTKVIRLNLKFLSHLDFVFAKAHLSKAMSASEPKCHRTQYRW